MKNDSGRHEVLLALRAELLGPSSPASNGAEPQRLRFSDQQTFPDFKSAGGPFVDDETGEEVLTRDAPVKRYGVGVLYPREQDLVDASVQADEGDDSQSPSSESASELLSEQAATFEPSGRADADDDDFDLTTTAQYRPSAMAISFLAELEPGDKINLVTRGARYEKVPVVIGAATRDFWVRRPIEYGAEFAAPDSNGVLKPSTSEPAEHVQLSSSVLARRREDSKWLLTVAVQNNSTGSPNTDSLFQATFMVEVRRDGATVDAVLPYPDESEEQLLANDPEAKSLDLLYRKSPTFAIGHGCAATWDEGWGQLTSSRITADPLPEVETRSVTPDVRLADGTKLEVEIGPLAGLAEGDDGFGAVERVVQEYEAWIADRGKEAEGLAGFRAEAAASHLSACTNAHARMAAGLQWLRSDPIAREAFRLANRSILEAQLRSRDRARSVTINSAGENEIEDADPTPDWRDANRRWRAFQIGFILANAKSAAEPTEDNRETAELIFFPTGGGKTEAYQGLAAFALFYQRLSGRDQGVSVLMRYTLRLLTSQQFLRAASLVCAMEWVWRNEGHGENEFSIGIWVGQSTTPTRRSDAIASWRRLSKGQGENPFLLLRCPWCAAQLGPVDVHARAPRGTPKIVGYSNSGGTVKFVCPDRSCDFRGGIPAYVIDEDVYEHRPSIVIGTVDKFAMLAYKPEARALFGLDRHGQRVSDPPNLIIQDELHLISGPLGSMVGLYESVIEDLCTDHRSAPPSKPKIVASTATIRRYQEQIRGLYNRPMTALFPPHGLDASDSFFAQYAEDETTGEPARGRLYVGVHAPGLGSIQTAQVRTSAALLQSAKSLPESDRDPWWTSMMFFNSLRELGTSVSLLQSDIPDYLLAMKNRNGIEFDEVRRLHEVMELTSRLRQDEIPLAISKLERRASDDWPVDVCLASNIIEVGIDIQRLSLLTVVGQPKSTSQYIQITGRVGRQAERPGLIVTIYGATKPRDRSHFERFQSYHQRLYAEVEPVSVTPFATPVLQRALHAVAIAYSRQYAAVGQEPWPYPQEFFDDVRQILEKRVSSVDSEEADALKRELARIEGEWLAWEPATWLDRDNSPLMRRAGEWVPAPVARTSWAVPMSMRDVDAECRSEITDRYAQQRASAGGAAE